MLSTFKLKNLVRSLFLRLGLARQTTTKRVIMMSLPLVLFQSKGGPGNSHLDVCCWKEEELVMMVIMMKLTMVVIPMKDGRKDKRRKGGKREGEAKIYNNYPFPLRFTITTLTL